MDRNVFVAFLHPFQIPFYAFHVDLHGGLLNFFIHCHFKHFQKAKEIVMKLVLNYHGLVLDAIHA